MVLDYPKLIKFDQHKGEGKSQKRRKLSNI